MDLVNQRTGDTLAEWLEKLSAELEIDAVSLWQVYGAGEEQFGLSADALDAFVRTAVANLAERGAAPVWGSAALQGWIAAPEFAGEPAAVASAMVAWWRQQSPEPDLPESPWLVDSEEILTP